MQIITEADHQEETEQLCDKSDNFLTTSKIVFIVPENNCLLTTCDLLMISSRRTKK